MSHYQSTKDLTDVNLRPTTSALGSRYAHKKQSRPSNMIIRPGQFAYAGESEPRYLPLGWTSFVQPEGQLYFARNSSPRVVTDAYLYSAVIQERILHYAAVVTKVIDAKQITLPDTAEIYLSPSQSGDECSYYVADHAAHILFWFEEVDLDQLLIPDLVSESHLRFALEDLYFQHVEQFPSHSPAGLSLPVDELISIFIHGEGDQITSSNSTFPFQAKECKKFINLLEAAKPRMEQPSSICTVARLWSVISRHRMQTHYAQEHARLSRDQMIIDIPETPRGVIFAATSRMLAGIPETYAAKLDRLFADEIVFLSPWRDFVDERRAEWQQSLSWSLGLAIVNALFLALPPFSSAIASLSLLCCAIAVVASLTLSLTYNDATTWCAEQVAEYLSESKQASPGFRRLALALSAPRATFIWAAFLASSQALYILQSATNVFVLAALIGLVLLARTPWGRWAKAASSILPRCRRVQDKDAMHMGDNSVCIQV
ncbi:hypothetical protein C2E23DRAFT_815397 [Lenzites betulinus]|nr:hypothetical protein C2E23DRAFT_815397 [Lenzites betulinus]